MKEPGEGGGGGTYAALHTVFAFLVQAFLTPRVPHEWHSAHGALPVFGLYVLPSTQSLGCGGSARWRVGRCKCRPGVRLVYSTSHLTPTPEGRLHISHPAPSPGVTAWGGPTSQTSLQRLTIDAPHRPPWRAPTVRRGRREGRRSARRSQHRPRCRRRRAAARSGQQLYYEEALTYGH